MITLQNYIKKKLIMGGEITFGFSFYPVPISFEIATSLGIALTNFVLTPKEEAIVSSIRKQADCSHNF